jgi:hypothetical protein
MAIQIVQMALLHCVCSVACSRSDQFGEIHDLAQRHSAHLMRVNSTFCEAYRL